MNENFEIVGKSESLLKLLEVAERVARSDATVLIRGESGTGKELLARYIWEKSRRKEQKFVAINCAAIPDNLRENELFGHRAGAFTDAKSDYVGKFGYADKGTVFLDEIAETSLSLQAKLLRVLQYKEYETIGSPEPLTTDVRLIAATNKNLYDLVRENKFREDLYYRLNVIPLVAPPLRERPDDVLLLAEYFLNDYNTKNSKSIKGFSRGVVDFLKSYSWPGNVRELQNLVERAVIISNGDYIEESDIKIDVDKTTKSAIEDIKPLK
ncbi:MAG TPA: sigma-54 dependent transcriptional regulator, partial [Spirochaetota bacterium]|nr:sigma-54 dependent transcriptional regulator [Spirochaetota bacterium]